MREWILKEETERLDLLRLVAGKTSLPVYMIEKDWWVTSTLDAIFSCGIQDKFAFKGGTSLSKSWKILDRFSEDIDIVIDKTLFGIGQNEEIGSTRRSKLRKEAHQYILTDVVPILVKQLTEMKIPSTEYKIVPEQATSDQDPTVLFLDYRPITEMPDGYTPQRVKIEIGVRALMEPSEDRKVMSLLAEELSIAEPVTISSILPERTFWEKVFLLHELFQGDVETMDIDKKSRHWYDLFRLYETGHATKAMADKELFDAIRKHRKIFTSVKGVDYDALSPKHFHLFPPDQNREAWEADYKKMVEVYIYKEPPTMAELVSFVKKLTFDLHKLG